MTGDTHRIFNGYIGLSTVCKNVVVFIRDGFEINIIYATRVYIRLYERAILRYRIYITILKVCYIVLVLYIENAIIITLLLHTAVSTEHGSKRFTFPCKYAGKHFCRTFNDCFHHFFNLAQLYCNSIRQRCTLSPIAVFTLYIRRVMPSSRQLWFDVNLGLPLVDYTTRSQ